MDPSEWKHVFANIQRQGLLIDENVLTDNFQDVVNKAFDPDMGFGYVSENGYKTSARVILQGKNPFLDSHTVSDDCNLDMIENITGLAILCDGWISPL